MARDTGTSRLETTSAGWAPWGSRRRMLLLGFAGPIIAIAVLAIGVYLLAKGSNGQALTAIGAALLVVWIVAIPIARRRRKI